MRLLLDTCAILWSVAEPEKLSEHTRTLSNRSCNLNYASGK
jgi:PIN domain nuclease of toxin-antitoxin system